MQHNHRGKPSFTEGTRGYTHTHTQGTLKKKLYVLGQQPVFAAEVFPQRVVFGQVVQPAAHVATTVETPADTLILKHFLFCNLHRR